MNENSKNHTGVFEGVKISICLKYLMSISEKSDYDFIVKDLNAIHEKVMRVVVDKASESNAACLIRETQTRV